MPPTPAGHNDHEDADERFDRFSGKSVPTRSRTGAAKPKQAKTSPSRAKRKGKSPSGMHNRRNKRMSW